MNQNLLGAVFGVALLFIIGVVSHSHYAAGRISSIQNDQDGKPAWVYGQGWIYQEANQTVGGAAGAPPQGGGQQQPQQLARPQGSTFIREDRTTPEYRLYSINDMHTAMVRVPANATNGVSVVVDIWCVPSDRLATLLEQEPPGLSIGKVRLIHNSTVLGVIAEPALLVGMKDISNFDGNWREYIAKTGLQLIDNATQSANLTSDQKAAIKQLRSEGELLAQNGQFRGAIDSLNTAIKMLGLKDRLYLNIPLRSTAP